MKEPEFYKHFVTVMNRGESTMGARGQEEGKYEKNETPYRARVIELKGATRIKERTMDATDKATLYLRWHSDINSDTHFIWKGKEYRQDGPPIIDREGNEIQTIIVSLQE